MLTESDWDKLDAIYADSGRHIRMIGKDAYVIADKDKPRISQEVYESHTIAALALIGNTYTPAAQRVETCVQHGTKNKVQWARKTKAKANVMNGGSL